MPVQQPCEEINGMRSPEGDIEYISWIVNLVLHGMAWDRGGQRGRQIDMRVRPIKPYTEGRFLVSNWQLQAKFMANFENMQW